MGSFFNTRNYPTRNFARTVEWCRATHYTQKNTWCSEAIISYKEGTSNDNN